MKRAMEDSKQRFERYVLQLVLGLTGLMLVSAACDGIRCSKPAPVSTGLVMTADDKYTSWTASAYYAFAGGSYEPDGGYPIVCTTGRAPTARVVGATLFLSCQ